MADLKFEITKYLGVLSESTKGWTSKYFVLSKNSKL